MYLSKDYSCKSAFHQPATPVVDALSARILTDQIYREDARPFSSQGNSASSPQHQAKKEQRLQH